MEIKVQCDCGQSYQFKVLTNAASGAYEEQLSLAREASKAQNDDELKAVMVKHEESAQPTAEEIATFRNTQLPKLKTFAEGNPSKAEFEKKFLQLTDTISFKFLVLKASMGLFTLLWLFLGVSSAYKIGAK